MDTKKVAEKALLLKELGLTTMSETLLEKGTGRDALKLAVEKYQYLTGKDLDDFNADIKKEGKRLEIVLIEDYKKLPPDHVLEALGTAKSLGCFDTFHIAYIVKIKDPILFGKVAGLDNLYFFIDQWGDDVTFEQILGV